MVHKIGNSFYYLTPVSLTDRPVLGIVVGKNKSLMIDAGNSVEHTDHFLKELQTYNVNQPNLVVLTHWHWDHIFGLPALGHTISIASMQTAEEMQKLMSYSWSDEEIDNRVRKGIEIEFCAKAMKEEYREHRDIQVVLPDVTFKERLEIDLGDVHCTVQHIGGDHAADSVIVYVQEEKILFVGDCMYAKMYAPKFHYTVKELLRVLDHLESYDADTYILSHGLPMTKIEFMEESNALRTIANYTTSCLGEETAIRENYQAFIGRELTQEDLETISYFVNGYKE